MPYPTLITGGQVKVDTIWGSESITIPPRTECKKSIRLFNKGFPRLGRIGTEERGFHHVEIDLLIPNISSTEHREILEKLKTIYQS